MLKVATFLARMIPKSMSSTPIGDGDRFSEKIMRKENVTLHGS